MPASESQPVASQSGSSANGAEGEAGGAKGGNGGGGGGAVVPLAKGGSKSSAATRQCHGLPG
eukprot:scaffold30594_cov36-Phaeocystis_antarctica.AAC.1